MTVEGRISAEVFGEFLRRLLAGMDRKIFLMVDGHPAHKAERIECFVREQSDQLNLCFLPPYSPELNFDELVWAPA